MSVASGSDSKTADAVTGEAPVQAPAAARLHRPWRALVAVVELALAGVLVWLAFVVWSHGITDITMMTGSGREVTLTRYHGDVIAGAIGLGTLAALLVLDAMRELMLAVRTKRGRKRNPDREEWPPFDEAAA